MKNALIIFVRKPELGNVKTRLAASIGDENALKIYIDLLSHTCDITKGLSLDKYVFYNELALEKDMWSKNGFYRKEQKGISLGEKMENAFESLRNEGYEKIIIIGSDCFELDESLISKAFEQLHKYDLVIGPANDGGYYLLGMSKFYPFIFQDKKWSTDSVCSDTLKDIQEHNLSCYQLPMLTDVDNEEDYNKTRKD
jgi:hypothetical protein